MNDEINNITTLDELWEWCKDNRKGAWRFPEKWGVRGYLGDLPIGIVADVPAPRSLKDLDDVFNTGYDRRLYRVLLKYGLENAHLMDSRISTFEDADQDRRVFLKQIELLKLEALLIMGGTNSKVWKRVEGYLKGWRGTLPGMYPIWHYTYRFVPNEEREKVFRSRLVQVADNHPNLASVIRLDRVHEELLEPLSKALHSRSERRIQDVGQVGRKNQMRQCDAIRQFIRRHGSNRAAVVAELASGLQSGQIQWNSNIHNSTAIEYADCLYYNYVLRAPRVP